MRGNRCPVRPRENRHRRSPELRVPPDTAGDRISAVDLNPRGAHGFPSGGAGTRTVSYALTAVRRCRRPGMNGGSVGRLDKRADRQCRWRLRVRVPRTDLTGRAATALALAVASRGRCQMGVKHPELDARRSTLDARRSTLDARRSTLHCIETVSSTNLSPPPILTKPLAASPVSSKWSGAKPTAGAAKLFTDTETPPRPTNRARPRVSALCNRR